MRRARLRSARDFAHVVDEERGAAEGGCGTGAVRVETAVRDLVSEAGDEDRGGVWVKETYSRSARAWLHSHWKPSLALGQVTASIEEEQDW